MDSVSGPAGRAWRVEFSPEEAERMPAAIGSWYFDCPGQSPGWDNYLLGCVALRAFPGIPESFIAVPGATHEYHMVALDPRTHPRVVDRSTWAPMHPVNMVEQVQLPDDQKAQELLDLCALAIVNGMLWAEPPLSGQVEPWRSGLIQSAAHLRGEEHGTGPWS